MAVGMVVARAAVKGLKILIRKIIKKIVKNAVANLVKSVARKAALAAIEVAANKELNALLERIDRSLDHGNLAYGWGKIHGYKMVDVVCSAINKCLADPASDIVKGLKLARWSIPVYEELIKMDYYDRYKATRVIIDSDITAGTGGDFWIMKIDWPALLRKVSAHQRAHKSTL